MRPRKAAALICALLTTSAAPARAEPLLQAIFGHAQKVAGEVFPDVRKNVLSARSHHDRLSRERGAALTVRASWYGGGHERLAAHTANGDRFDPRAMTAASMTLPMGARVRVCRASRCVVVRINDRGPSPRLHRALDLSRAAAAAIGLTRIGVGSVSLERL